MHYKTLLVHLDASMHADTRIRAAANLAVKEDAHLIGAALTGVTWSLYQPAGFGLDSIDLEPLLEEVRKQAKAAIARFEAIANEVGVTSFESRLIDDDAVNGLSLHARYADLVVLGQPDPDEYSYTTSREFPELVAMQSAVPVLAVPYATPWRPLGNRILVAWNGSREARRAIHYALPLLEQAKAAQVVVFNAGSDPSVHGEQPGADIALYLARHGIRVEVAQRSCDKNVGEALLSAADDYDADMIVMGCYGHARAREILLGGATRTMLRSMTVPVLLAH